MRSRKKKLSPYFHASACSNVTVCWICGLTVKFLPHRYVRLLFCHCNRSPATAWPPASRDPASIRPFNIGFIRLLPSQSFMVVFLRRRSGVAPFGSLQKSSVWSALMLLARAAPRCLKSQKIPVGCRNCSRIPGTFAHFGSHCGAGISWPCSQLLHSLFFFESIRAGAENTGSQALAQVRC